VQRKGRADVWGHERWVRARQFQHTKEEEIWNPNMARNTDVAEGRDSFVHDFVEIGARLASDMIINQSKKSSHHAHIWKGNTTKNHERTARGD
jgi:hypothetical protein